ncbi:MAG: hypothetical protein WCG27_03815 [Pseudomonadota bacterium]
MANRLFRRVSIILTLWSALATPIFAEVQAPNYDFSLDALQIFYPGNKKEDIEAKYGKGEVMEKNDKVLMVKYYIAHLRYKFPVIVQYIDGQTSDFYARLPSYFLHDVFHQSLINRIGKQDQYEKKNEEATYSWNNKDGKRHVYGASCTITCFPIFYTVITANPPKSVSEYKPLLTKLQANYGKIK